MSSILKALKKLEQETREKQTEPLPATGLNIRPGQNRRKEKARRTTNETTQWIWILCLVLFFIGAGTFATFFFRGPGTVTPAPPQAAQAPKPVHLKTAAKPAPDIAVVASPPPSTPAPLDIPSKPVAPMTHATPWQSPAPATHATPPKRPGPTHQDAPPQFPAAVSSNVTSPPAQATQDTQPQPPAPTAHGTAGTEIPVMEDASLTINAISWSTVPEKRLAVINSTLVREGQTVGGFHLVEIEEDQVIVQQSHKKWRVMFRLR